MEGDEVALAGDGAEAGGAVQEDQAVGVLEDAAVVQIVGPGPTVTVTGSGSQVGSGDGGHIQVPGEGHEFGGALARQGRRGFQAGRQAERIEQEQSRPVGGGFGAQPVDGVGAVGGEHADRETVQPGGRFGHHPPIGGVFGCSVEVLAGFGGQQAAHRRVAVGLERGQDDGPAAVAVVAGDAQQQRGGAGHGPPRQHRQGAGRERSEQAIQCG